MNPHLQTILQFIQDAEHLSEEEKNALVKEAKAADKELEITAFKLGRTEKVKHTTAILLRETIEELESKRKAVETQNRELEIEAALEKVRSRSLAMHNSDELKEVVAVVYDRLKELDFRVEEGATTIIIFLPNSKIHLEWIADSERSYPKPFEFPDTDHSIKTDLISAHESGLDSFTKLYPFEEKNAYLEYRFLHTEFGSLPEHVKKMLRESKSYGASIAIEKNSAILFASTTGKLLSDIQMGMLKRFAKVFEQTYTRFLDLQKAEAQAREAQIEAALEKVRSRSLAMHQSEELKEVVAIVFEKFHELNFQADGGVGIMIFDDETKGVDYWAANPDYISASRFSAPYFDHVINNDIWEIRKKGGDFHSKTYSFEQKNSFWDFLIEHTDFKYLPEENKTAIYVSENMINAFALSKHSAIGVITYLGKPFSKEQIETIKRFARVFEQAYTRFLDLQNAEAQAREARIQLALERVRARTMAMQRSDELHEVIRVVTEQLQQLGFHFDTANFITNYTEKGFDWYISTPGVPTPANFYCPTGDLRFFKMIANGIRNELDFYADILSLEEKNELFEYAFKNTPLKDTPEERKQYVFDTKGIASSSVLCKNVILSIANYQLKPYTNEENVVLQRIGKVFEQSYTRFLDLQKAEAQAREAQIELGLERVRARAMAMQRSDELKDLISTVSVEINKLDIVLDRCLIVIYDLDTLGATWWMANREVPAEPMGLFVKYHEHPPYLAHLQAWKERQQKWEYLLEGETKKTWDKFLFRETELTQLPAEASSFMKGLKRVYLSSSFNNFGYLQFATLEPLKDEQFDILFRFGRVIDLTYTRFNDLQNAEAQARESQIQLALERVRARTMAMQRSDELADVAQLLFQQVKELGIKAWTTGFNIWQEDNASYIDWLTGPSGEFLEPYTVDLTSHPAFKAIMDARQRGDDFFMSEWEGEQIVEGYRLLTKFGDKGQFQQILDSGIQFPTHQFNHLVFGAQVSLLFVTYETSPEARDIFKRFGKVFEQTYTRFLDLQKAEAQARESQIQLALERVRARTMAMHRSAELAEAATLLFKQLQELGASLWTCGFAICDKDKDTVEKWMSNMSGQIIDHPLFFPISHPEEQEAYNAWKNGIELTTNILEGEELKRSFENLMSLPSVNEILNNFEESGGSFPTWVQGFVVTYRHGYLLIVTTRPFEESQIFVRFAKVFEQTYTRFLDLQKAEAQAREAQIQLALERVRARTMAMQHSDELSETVYILFQQFKELGENPDQATIGIINEEERVIEYWVTMYGNQLNRVFKFSIDEPHVTQKIYNAWKKQEKSLVIDLSGQELREFSIYRESMGGAKLNEAETRRIINVAIFSKGLINVQSNEYRSKESINLLERFAAVFEQTYTRFLDLQKAEAQARESQIQLALERVRARTMAMQRSEELPDAATVLFQQVIALGVPLWTCGFGLWELGDAVFTWYPGSPDGGILPPCQIPLTEHPVFISFDESRRRGDELLVYEKEGEFQKDHYQYMLSVPGGLGKMMQGFLDAGIQFPSFQVDHVAPFSHGNLAFITYKHFPEMHDVFKRFAKVFEQTYTRFLDLQKAEAQARESRIEASLERVRARAMAMHKTDELLEAAELLYKELTGLGISSMVVTYSLMDSEEKNAYYYSINPVDGKIGPKPFVFPHTETDIMREILASWKKQEAMHLIELDEEATIRHQTYIGEHVQSFITRNEMNMRFSIEAFLAVSPKKAVIYTFNFTQGYIFIIGGARLTAEEEQMVLRFTKVFELTYRRFLDLNQAEAQAKEAQIEAGLERVRSRSMGMQKSEELKEVIQVVYEQFVHLNIHIDHTGFVIDYKARDDYNIWIADPLGVPSHVIVPYFDSIYYNRFNEAKEKGEDFFATNLTFEEKNKFYQKLFEYVPGLPEESKKFYFSCPGLAASTVLLDNVCLYIENFSGTPYSDEDNATLKRFGKVFQQTYTRFNDLKQAEAQARESQIEAALERVRSRSMGMQKSDELRDVIKVIYEQLVQLNFEINNAGFLVDYRESDDYNIWMADALQEFPTQQHIPYFDHLINREYLEQRKKGQELFTRVYSFEEKNSWFGEVFKSMPGVVEESKEILFGTPAMSTSRLLLKNIGLYLFNYSGTLYSDSENATLIRFGKVFEQTYIRFNDLKNAEAQALEAIKQASVDRVRAEIASMRTTYDLERIQPLIWNELTTLGVPFIRCGVFIMDDLQEKVLMHLSTPDGKAIAVFQLPYDAPFNIPQIVKNWHKKAIYKQHWDTQKFIDFTKYLVQEGAIASGEKYLSENKPTDLYLHFLPFLQGMLYVGSSESLSDDALQLVQNLADAFSTAYARYDDFNKLESAKEQIEKTLVDLKQTQAQLVQSEKMASLGELTAGIAHEIQNPLNFVNNFSEVNRELIQELKNEILSDHRDQALSLINDLDTNEEKINHHGKRADSIVRGMLQHSRETTGQKESVNMNALADEYLRLSYQGLRAKDKTFNVSLQTQFDPGLGKVNIIPQDIGRVLLNLYNNAFYAVSEKKKKQPGHFEPTVSVTTKKTNGKVEIIVKDNGNGIPQKVVEKIFQPFFTTKPTGQGTGLGLSLSYDIIKAHGGEIKVETNEGEGAEFSIQFPVA